VVPCETGLSCSAGECTDECIDECDESTCDGLTHRPCGQYDADECLDDGPTEDCAAVDPCIEAACVAGDGCTTVARTGCDPVVRVAAGGAHACAVDAAGAASCWGGNAAGQLGDGTLTTRLVPVGVSGLTEGVVAIDGGDVHTCAVNTSGQVFCWGTNFFLQLGGGSEVGTTTPAMVPGLPAGITTIATGKAHNCVSTGAGAVLCWGNNEWGQLGNGAGAGNSPPVSVTGLSAGVTELSANVGFHTCARLAPDDVRCWGLNQNGQIGDGTSTDRLVPADVVALPPETQRIAAGVEHSCAIDDGGALWCWGDNGFGQLGDGTTTDRSMPVPVTGLSSGVIAVSLGLWHSCAITGDGAGWCWGRGPEGQLGNGEETTESAPVPVADLGAMTQIALGDLFACAVYADDSIRCWGNNGTGQLGDGTTTSRATPVEVIGTGGGS
jgi:alpha-tubulin suppressor-like RCC1 family protein